MGACKIDCIRQYDQQSGWTGRFLLMLPVPILVVVLSLPSPIRSSPLPSPSTCLWGEGAMDGLEDCEV